MSKIGSPEVHPKGLYSSFSFGDLYSRHSLGGSCLGLWLESCTSKTLFFAHVLCTFATTYIYIEIYAHRDMASVGVAHMSAP